MSEITQLLNQASRGDDSAMDQVFARLFQDLRALARNRLQALVPGQTLTPTALVNELYLKLTSNTELYLESRAHFFGCAGQAMRQIVIDHLRSRNAEKRGGLAMQITLTDIAESGASTEDFDLSSALQELEEIDPALGRLVDLKFFAGLPVSQIAELTERSERSVKRDWARARAILHARLALGTNP